MHVRSFLPFACAIALLGCPDNASTPDSGTPLADVGAVDSARLTTVSFATDVSPIMSSSCAGSRCHGSADYAFLMGSTSCRSAVEPRYVVPGDADRSYVVAKLEGASTICGSAMPAARRLTAEQIGTIRTWINEGALNN